MISPPSGVKATKILGRTFSAHSINPSPRASRCAGDISSPQIAKTMPLPTTMATTQPVYNNAATLAGLKGALALSANAGLETNRISPSIEWSPYGNKKFIPGKTIAEKRRDQENAKQQRLIGTLTKANKTFFMMQMATLGVAFSFMTLQNTIIGIFSSLQDLGGVFKNLALGKAFGGVDLKGAMGVDSSALVQGWKNITGIFSNIQALMALFATMTLNEEVMTQLNAFFVELGKALADPKVVEAMQQIVLAAIDFGKSLIPVLPVLAEAIILLGETGLLKVLVGFVLIAGTLLSAMSLLQWGFQGFLAVATLLAPYLTATVIPAITAVSNAFMAFVGGSLATAALVIAGVLIIVDAFVRVLQELYTSGISVTSVVNGLIKAFNDVYNVVVTIMNGISSVLGMGNMFQSNVPLQWLWGNNNGTSGSSTNVTNNYTFSGTVTDPNYALTQARKARNTSAY